MSASGDLQSRAINTIRFLAADAVQTANSGHPGLPMTCRLEENVLVTADGPVIFTQMEHMDEAMR